MNNFLHAIAYGILVFIVVDFILFMALYKHRTPALSKGIVRMSFVIALITFLLCL